MGFFTKLKKLGSKGPLSKLAGGKKKSSKPDVKPMIKPAQPGASGVQSGGKPPQGGLKPTKPMMTGGPGQATPAARNLNELAMGRRKGGPRPGRRTP
jgi:hypothetical protein